MSERYDAYGRDNAISRGHGLIIQTDVMELQEDAMQKQQAWFADADNQERKIAFADALRRWGKAAGKRDAVTQADKLLGGAS